MDLKAIIKALGVQKCNGSLDAATEDLPSKRPWKWPVRKQDSGI